MATQFVSVKQAYNLAVGTELTLRGWARSRRDSKGVTFIELNDDLPGSVEPAQLTATAAQRAIRSWLASDQNRAFLKAARDQTNLQTLDSHNPAALAIYDKGLSA